MWEKTKDQVDSLPKDYKSVLGTYQENKPYNINTSNSGKLKRIRVRMKPINGYDVEMVVYKNKDGSVKEAWYVTFNEETNMCYKRTIERE